MRQDARFKDGEAVTSASFARLLSSSFDALVTVDPHLHRRASLDEIFSIPSRVARAAPLLADWIAGNVKNPLVIGPDVESEQWVAAVAQRARAPHIVMTKERLGDRAVRISSPDLPAPGERTPVLVDDMISSGETMIEAARLLQQRGMKAPFCLTVHALFAEEAHQRLMRLAQRIISTDTVPHPTNAISVVDILAEPV
jgi:ribose-phosphate pyrophosphokinase